MDRVDGVDRPVTGRAFAILKSQGPHPTRKDQMDAIVAQFRELRKGLESDYAASAVVKRGNEYVVKFGNREAGFKERDDAEGFARELYRQTHPEMYADDLDERGQKEPTSTHVNSGTLAALDDPTNNAAGVPLTDRDDEQKPKRKSLMDIHRESMARRGRTNKRDARIL